MTEFDPSPFFRFVDVLGVVANAFLGAAVARRMKFDLIGFVVLSVISAVGGGVLRDLLLSVGVPVAFTDPLYLSSAVITAALAYLVKVEGRWSHRLLLVADVLVLGCWSATGALKALGVGLGWLPAVVLGVTTAVGGGMVRDVVVGRVPAVFGGNTLYATVAVVGSVEMVALAAFRRPNVGMAVAILTCAALGLLARWRRWTLPGALEWEVPLPDVRRSGRVVRRVLRTRRDVDDPPD